MNELDLIRADDTITQDMKDFMRTFSRKPRWHQRNILRGGAGGIGRHLYKYYQLDPEVAFSIKKVRDVLVDSKMWLSKPTSFNDPFDFRVNAELSDDPVRRRRYFETISKIHVQRGPRYRERLAEATRLTQEKHIRNPRLVTKLFDDMADRYGVCCFSDQPRSILMWSHYADSHRGICLQFEVTRDSRFFSRVVPVRYTQTFPSMTWPDDKEDVIDRVILPKFDAWSYEAERRFVTHTPGDRAFPFAAPALSGVIVGYKASTEAKRLLKELLDLRESSGLPTPKVFYMHRDPKAYRLRVMRAPASYLGTNEQPNG